MGFSDILIKYDNLECLTVDSRGNQLFENDNVLVFTKNNEIIYYFSVIINTSNNVLSVKINYLDYAKEYYIFKLNNFNYSLDTYLDLFDLDNRAYIYFRKYNYVTNNESIKSLYDICGNYFMNYILYAYRNKHNSIRSFTALDLSGQHLSVGDLVVYKQESSSYGSVFKYGVLISDTKVFNEDKIIERVCFVYKLNNLNQSESLLLQELSLAYQSMHITVKNKTKNKGDIFVKGKYVYLYLGKIDFYLDYIGESNVICDIKLDNNKEYWLRFNSNVPPNNFEDLKNYISSTFYDTSIVVNKKYFINENIFCRYLSLFDIKNLSDTVPKGLVYHSSINIKDDLIISVSKYEFYNSKFHIHFL